MWHTASKIPSNQTLSLFNLSQRPLSHAIDLDFALGLQLTGNALNMICVLMHFLKNILLIINSGDKINLSLIHQSPNLQYFLNIFEKTSQMAISFNILSIFKITASPHCYIRRSLTPTSLLLFSILQASLLPQGLSGFI